MVLVLLALTISAAIAYPLVRRLGAKAGAFVLPLPLLGAFAWLLAQAPDVLAGEPLSQAFAFVPRLGIELAFRLDGLALVFALLITLIGALVLVHGAGYLKDGQQLGKLAALLLIFGTSMLALVLADDLLVLFVCWELTSISSFLLIGFDSGEREGRDGAVTALLVTTLGALAMLVGFVLLAAAAGTYSISEVLASGEAVRASPLYLPALVLIALGAFTKSAQVPFHYWLPGAMAAPSPVSAYLHSATLVKAGVYLLLRLSPAFGGRVEWHVLLAVVGSATLVTGAVLAYPQQDLKRLLAYTTISALGVLVALIGIGTPAAIHAALLFLVVHAFYKASLFMVAGFLDKRTGTRDIGKLRALARTLPAGFAIALLAALSMTGLPPFLGAVSKELVITAQLGSPFAPMLLAVLGTLAQVLVVACAMLVAVRPFYGLAGAPALVPKVASFRLLLGPGVLALLGLFVGFASGELADPLMLAALRDLLPRNPLPELEMAQAPLAAGWLSKGSLVGGLGLYLFRRRILAAASALAALARLGPARLHTRLVDGLFTAAAHVDAASSHDPLRRGLVTGFGLVAVAGLAPYMQHGLPAWSGEAIPMVQEIALVGLVLAGTFASVELRSRLGAVASLGAIGFGVAALFLVLGGPDLAMTQVAVETLAVLMLVFVLVRAPRLAEGRTAGERVVDAALPLAVGVVFTLVVLGAAPDGAPRPLTQALAAASAPEAHGRNIVNVILVDFRALDTLGEIVVLAAAAVGVVALLRGGRAQETWR